MTHPKISIVTPSFNQGEFLEQTICSVINQEYPNLEYVVVDGGSSDQSVDIIKKYQHRLSFWVSEKDKGQYDAINKGFERTTGEIMGWINSSDVYYPWTFRIIAEIFASNPQVEWLSGMPTNLSVGTAPLTITNPKQRNIYDFAAGDYKWLQQESIFWKRSLWEKAGSKLDLNVKYAGDLDLWLRFFRHSNLYYVNTILGGFRYHDVRRGNDIYEAEAEKLYREFKTRLPASTRRRARISKLVMAKDGSLKNIFRRLKLFSWYQHHNIYYDYSKNDWLLRVK